MSAAQGPLVIPMRSLVAGVVTASLVSKIKKNIKNSCIGCGKSCSSFCTLFTPSIRNQVAPARAATGPATAPEPRVAWITIAENQNVSDVPQVRISEASTASETGGPITTRVSISSSVDDAIFEMVLRESLLQDQVQTTSPGEQVISTTSYPVTNETREFLVNVKKIILGILGTDQNEYLTTETFSDNNIMENLHRNGYMICTAKKIEAILSKINELQGDLLTKKNDELVAIANEVLQAQESAMPLVVVNPDGTSGGLQVAVKVADKKLEGLSALVSEIMKFFDITSFDQSVTVTLPAPASGGKNKGTELLLGRHRKIFKEGRKKMVMIKGKKVPLVDARKLHAKWEKMKL